MAVAAEPAVALEVHMNRRSLLLGAAACALAVPAARYVWKSGLDATPRGLAASSYVSRAEADYFFQQSTSRLHRWPCRCAVVRVVDIDTRVMENVERKLERYQWVS